MTATTTTEPTFEQGIRDGEALAANCTDSQLAEELETIREMVGYYDYFDGKLHALSMALGARK